MSVEVGELMPDYINGCDGYETCEKDGVDVILLIALYVKEGGYEAYGGMQNFTRDFVLVDL